MNNKLAGSWVALVTPFDNGQPDLAALTKLVNFQIENGTNGIVALGSTGEAATLDETEYETVLSTIVKTVAGRIPVMAGTGSNSTAATIRRTALAKKCGADYALVVAPFYNKPTAEGQIAHFQTIADQNILPIVIYNVPSRTGINMLPETVAKLSEHPNIIGIKEASGNVEQMGAIMDMTGNDFCLLSGDDGLTVPAMAIGAQGVISVTANILPKMVSEMVAAANNGDFAKARELHYRLRTVNKVMFAESNPIPVKFALSKMGMIKEEYRLPLTKLSAAHHDLVWSAVSQLL